MYFQRIAPAASLTHIIDCYWIIKNDDPTPRIQKIIPDGFPEMIFHYGEPYRIFLESSWQLQAKTLVAGQIRKHFFLENTGIARVLGIKFQPAAIAGLFGLPMHELTGKVLPVALLPLQGLAELEQKLLLTAADSDKITVLNDWFKGVLCKKPYIKSVIDKVVDLVIEQHGMISVSTMVKEVGIGERQLENLFKHHVGLSPKLFARIIRFSYIFQLLQENEQSWCSLAYEAAFCDQSHFIRNFKDFTGENPADYAFDEKNMANFFLFKR